MRTFARIPFGAAAIALRTTLLLLGCGIAAAPAFSATPAVKAGWQHGVALAADGTVRTWGSDEYSQLGIGRPTFYSTPGQVLGLSGVVAISAGAFHTTALKSDGTVWTWGYNFDGQLGDGSTIDRSAPLQVAGLANVTAIFCGAFNTYALKQDGTVWGWGSNFYDSLGDGNPQAKRLTPVQVTGLTGVLAIAGGHDHGLALKANGTVWAWGNNLTGQLGDNTTTQRSTPVQVMGITGVIAIAASSSFNYPGKAHSVALKSDGAVWTWGFNDAGQLGDGSTTDRWTPVQAAGFTNAIAITAGVGHTSVLRADRTVWSVGSNSYGQFGNANSGSSTTVPVQATDLAGVRAISAGTIRMAAVKLDGTAWGWGYNSLGELGDGTTNFRPSPVQSLAMTGVQAVAAGYNHTAALKSDGTVWAWGSNSQGQLGNGASTSRSSPVVVPGLTGAIAIAAGGYHSFAVKGDGSLWGWGHNAVGQLGDGTYTDRPDPIQLGTLTGAAEIAGGLYFTVARTSDGNVWTWGSNEYGQLGDGSPSAFYGRTTPAQVVSIGGSALAIAAGQYHALALRNDGRVFAWGSNQVGQIGDGTTTLRSTPTHVVGLTSVIAIAAGSNHSLALKSDGTVWAWGAGGALGDGTMTSRSLPVQVPGLTGIAGIAGGGNHGIAVKGDGTVWAWGFNDYGQVGDDSTTLRLSPVPVPGLAGVAPSMSALSAGYDFTFARKTDGSVYSWGRNERVGPLGDGTFVSRSGVGVVIAPNGSGSVEANDWFLDLDPSVATVIPAALVPSMLVVSQLSGSGGLEATTKYKAADLGKTVNRYALALVPPEYLQTLQAASGAMSTAKLKSLAKAGLVLAQLTPTGWSAVTGALGAFASGTAGAAGDANRIANSVPISSLPPGTRFCIGYGESAQAMLGADTIREVLRVGTKASSEGGTPCVLSGVYLEGPATSVAGSSVTFKASIVGAAPTGTLQFKDNGTNLLAPVALAPTNPAVSFASISTSTLATGVHGIGARYSGDANNTWGPETEVTPLGHEVKSGAGVALSVPPSSQVGQQATFVATVTGNNPTGLVQFKDGGFNLGAPQPLNSQSTATLQISSLAQGPHSISAAYLGDGSNAGATSSALPHTVYAAVVTGITLGSSPNPSTPGGAVTLTATVTGTSPAGTVTFNDGASMLGQATLSGGSAMLVVSSLAVGPHTLGASYPGDANNQPVSVSITHQVNAPVTKVPSTTALSSSLNPSTLAQGILLTATVSGSSGTPTGTVTFRDGATTIAGCAAVSLSSGAAACSTNALAAGSRSITAEYSGNAAYLSGTSLALTQVVNAGTSLLTASPNPLEFGGQSINTTSPPLVATFTNASGGPLTISAITIPPGFLLQGTTCTTLAAGASCTVTARFVPPREGPIAGLVGLSYAGGGPSAIEVNGIGEKSLSTHYYWSILRRAPDAGGKQFWEGEAARMQSIGANINEAWFAMAQFFFFSPEYLGFNRDDNAFVTDLYVTFFNRQPDGGGLVFWTGLLAQGMPREVILASFMFSPEFAGFAQAIFGNTAARAEVDTVMDFYRGMLARLPDASGFTTWVTLLRAAQCAGAGNVYGQVESISSTFANSSEYIGKNRTNAQYVGDLYNAFLRRGGDLEGVQSWIGFVTNPPALGPGEVAGTPRERVRRYFIASAEFQGRVNAVVAQGCMP